MSASFFFLPIEMKPLILFDLDGTLVDSAPGLVDAVNRLRQRRHLEPLPYTTVRPFAGMGARGLLKIGLDMPDTDPLFEETKKEFLDDYEAHCTENIETFAGINELLSRIEKQDWQWGIVTNKFECFAKPILEKLELYDRAAVVVCGDATMKLKPHPDNLIVALQKTAREATECVYVGDDIRDAQAAGKLPMPFAAASWGYLGQVQDIGEWSAQYVATDPMDLMEWLVSVFRKA